MTSSRSPRRRTTSRSSRAIATPGKSVRERLVDALGALADGLDGEAALRTARRQRRIGAAVMAAQALRGKVHREPRVALAARRDPAAGGAQQRRRIAAAVEEHQHLAAVAQMPLDREHRGRGDTGACAR